MVLPFSRQRFPGMPIPPARMAHKRFYGPSMDRYQARTLNAPGAKPTPLNAIPFNLGASHSHLITCVCSDTRAQGGCGYVGKDAKELRGGRIGGRRGSA